MRRYWIDRDQVKAGQVYLSGDLLHHICRVCRQEVGDRFEVLTSDSQALLVELVEVSAQEARAVTISQRPVAALKSPFIRLALSLPKYPVFEAVLEKAVELGVHSIQPFVSERSFIRKAENLSENKSQRWEKIIRSASQQSGRGDLMALEPLVGLDQVLAQFNRIDPALGLFLYEGEARQNVKGALQEIKKNLPQEALIWAFVGSEGGFSSPEVEKFQKAGLQPVTLGSQVLRVETACLALVAVIKYELELMKA